MNDRKPGHDIPEEELKARTVSFDLLEETYQDALDLARENGWPEDEALLIIFANGLAYLRARHQVVELARNGTDEHVVQELNKTVRQLMRESSRYAALKFKAFRMSQDIEALEMHESGLAAENRILLNRLERFREDEERLKARIAELEDELDAVRRELRRPDEGPPRLPTRPPVVSQAAWKVGRLKNIPGQAEPYSQAENLLPTVPLRFQKYIEELLFDDERILFFVARPSSMPDSGKIASLLRRQRMHEALLMVTDRMVVFMEDVIPPSGYVHWGYRATLTAVERIRDAAVLETEGALTFRAMFGAARKGRRGDIGMDIPFPGSHARPLQEAVSLLKRFASPRGLVPRRVYTGAPRWEPADIREHLRALRGREPGEPPEWDRETIRGSCRSGAVSVVDERRLVLEAGGEPIEVEIADVLAVDLVRALTKCGLTVHYVAAGKPMRWDVAFQYPESRDFVRVVSRLRHLLGHEAPTATTGAHTDVEH